MRKQVEKAYFEIQECRKRLHADYAADSLSEYDKYTKSPEVKHTKTAPGDKFFKNRKNLVNTLTNNIC